MAAYRPPIIAEAMQVCRDSGTPVIHLAAAAGMGREAFYRWGQKAGNGATVGCLDAMPRAAGYELRIAKIGAPR